MSEPKSTGGDRLLWGAGEIGKAIQRDEQATSRMLRLGQIPGVRIGDRWVTSEARLRHFVAWVAIAGTNDDDPAGSCEKADRVYAVLGGSR
jgi:hypothetical protein